MGDGEHDRSSLTVILPAPAPAPRACVLVSHTHWDREWYRTFQAFRARLVDTIDRVLDQLAEDPGWSFLLDGQTVVIEDYLEVRPHRAPELARACAEGRLGIGPWYVQPDSLLPSGEAHVRNLLEGRRVGATVGEVSRVAYTPDSFGHPAQFPQLLAGFGLRAFVYWRGNGSELDRLGPLWRWVAPDGTALAACHLGRGYFAAAGLGDDTAKAAERLEGLVEGMARPGLPEVLLMNGVDHALPDPATAEACAALAERTGWQVRRGLLDDHVARLLAPGPPGAEHTGELVGGRVANLLPGVWSARLYLKARNRAAQAALEGWAEPWAAWGRALGCPDERPALRLAWRSLLVNQAHDSICGCSADRVHDQMLARYDTAQELADETASRALERLAGLGPQRRVPWRDALDVAVWNPSPHARTDVVRFPLDGHPLFDVADGRQDVHPLGVFSLLHRGVTVDGRPARVVVCDAPARVRLIPEQQPWDVEFVASDVPAFGWRRYRVEPGPATPSTADGGRRIAVDDLAVEVDEAGCLSLSSGGRTWDRLLAVDDVGDRGDTYDFDPVAGPDPVLLGVEVERLRHPGGVEELMVRRRLGLPAGLASSRDERRPDTVTVGLQALVRLVPGTGRVDVEVTLDNTAEDHRLRLLFPTGDRSGTALAATTFDAVTRVAGAADGGGWVHPAPATFCHQGWVSAGGLNIGAPGLPEAELGADGTVALTVVRAVGWLARIDLRTRTEGAGPGLRTPGAQCPGGFSTMLHLWCGERPAGEVAAAARDAELGLRAVPAGPAPLVQPGPAPLVEPGPAPLVEPGPAPLVEPGRPLLELSPPSLVLSALKPAEDGDGTVVRVLNVGDDTVMAVLRCGLAVRGAVAVRLDEEPAGEEVNVDGETVTFSVPAHALRSVTLDLAR